jgi:hypothetical protein
MASGLPRLTGGHAAAATSTGPTQDSSLPPLTGGQAATSSSLPPLTGTTPVKSPPPKKTGLLGGIEHVAHKVESGTQAALGKTHDVTASIVTGLYHVADLETQALKHDVQHPNLGHHESLHDFLHGNNNPASHQLGQIEAAQGRSIVQSATSPSYIEHHPVTALLNDLALVSGGVGAVGKVAYLGKVANAARVAETGDLVEEGSAAAKAAEGAGHTVKPLTPSQKARLAARTAVARPPAAERTLRVPKLEGPSQPTEDVLAAGRKVKNRVNARAAVKRGEKPKLVIREQPEGPAQLRHESVQIATASRNPVARGFQAVHDAVAQKALDNGVTAAKQTRTARYAERRVAGSVGEGARITRNVRNADVAKVTAAARNLDRGVPARIGQLAMFLRSANVTGKEAADYWAKQAAAGIGDRVKVGRGAGQRQTAYLSKLAQAVHDRGLLKLDEAGNVAVDAERYPRLGNADQAVKLAQDTRAGIIADHGLISPEGLQSRLDLVGQKILGDQARPGQGFVTLKTAITRTPQSPVARSRGSVIPLAKPLAVGKRATGRGIEKGLVPVSTTNAVARGLHEALRFVNSDELRGRVAKLGSDAKRTGDDILVRDPAADKAGKISQQVEQILGRSESTVTEPGEDNLRLAGRKLLEKAIPGLRDEFAENRAAAIGTRAPAGFKWVPKQLVPDDLTTAVQARGKVEKFADAVNSAVTSATVYLKLGHLPTRLLTNLSTNAVQGSFSPREIGKSAHLAHELTDAQKLDLTAATGTHGYQALPHAGAGAIAKIASKGANAWARKIDAPFRLNAILYELRQIGIDTPETIDKAIAQLKDPSRSGMSASQISRLDGAVRRANRASIMYDGLSAAEKRYVARYVWFYPWTKGAVRFAGHAAVEHPVKGAAIGQAGAEGSDYRRSVLGDVPPYELGLTPFTHGDRPLTGTLSSFTPFSTVGDVAELAAHPLNPDSGIIGQLNPYYGGVASLATAAAGGKKHAFSGALHDVVQPTPEAQVVNAYLHPPTNTKMFGPTPLGVHNPRAASVLSALLRAAGGAAVPRPTNRGVLAAQARRHRR